MPLIKVKILNRATKNSPIPTQEEGWINTDDIVKAMRSEVRGSDPALFVVFRDRSSLTIVHTDLSRPEKAIAANPIVDEIIEVIKEIGVLVVDKDSWEDPPDATDLAGFGFWAVDLLGYIRAFMADESVKKIRDQIMK